MPAPLLGALPMLETLIAMRVAADSCGSIRDVSATGKSLRCTLSGASGKRCVPGSDKSPRPGRHERASNFVIDDKAGIEGVVARHLVGVLSLCPETPAAPPDVPVS